VLNLIELARKWLPRNGRPLPDDIAETELAERDEFNRRAGEVWLAYHDNEPWAKAKLARGMVLTPEALEYMERAVNARNLADEARKKNLETENGNPEPTENRTGERSIGPGPGVSAGPDGGERTAVEPGAGIHASDCAIHSEPAEPAGPCTCTSIGPCTCGCGRGS
jgi:hypothetical protein